MDYFEIILNNLPKKKLNTFVHTELLTHKKHIISSQFYDTLQNKNLSIMEIKDIEKIMTPKGSGTMLFSSFIFGVNLGETVIAFSADINEIDIDINFKEKDFFVGKKEDVLAKCKKLIEHTLTIKRTYNIPVVFIGQEPATDSDMCLLKLDNKNINIEKAAQKLAFSLNK